MPLVIANTARLWLALVLLLVPLLARAGQPKPKTRQVTVAEAEQLVCKVVENRGAKDHKGIGLEKCGSDPDFPQFLYFMTYWPGPPSADGVGVLQVSYFGVDPVTADVWDAVICREYKYSSLRKAQRELHKRMGLTESEYRRLRRPGPMCGPGLPKGK